MSLAKNKNLISTNGENVVEQR